MSQITQIYEICTTIAIKLYLDRMRQGLLEALRIKDAEAKAVKVPLVSKTSY